jgi:hypothetical protein
VIVPDVLPTKCSCFARRAAGQHNECENRPVLLINVLKDFKAIGLFEPSNRSLGYT